LTKNFESAEVRSQILRHAMPPPPLPSEIQYRKLKKEICVFAPCLGALL
jgi:hypothetical protein